MTRIFASAVFTGNGILKDQLISAANGVITAIEPSIRNADIPAVTCLAPGFIDAHINGGEEFYFTGRPLPDTLEDINDACAALGTAYSLPALITSPVENMLKGIEAVKQYRLRYPGSGVLGLHLEGPFIHPVKRGAHLADYIRKPSSGELEEIIRHGKDVVRMITIAPEVFTGEQLEMLLDSGIVVSAGHSNATYNQAVQAFGMGVNLVTHLYNAMSPLAHREPGLVGAALDTASVYTPVIADGAHCDFAAARIAWKLKGDKMFLISDALFAGRKKQSFQWGRFDAYFENDRYINSEGNLAGSVISLGDAVRNAVNEIGIPLSEAIEMVTIRPARALRIDHIAGRIEEGYPARFTAFDLSLQNFETIRL